MEPRRRDRPTSIVMCQRLARTEARPAPTADAALDNEIANRLSRR